jgi:sugar (pentulose or hexulose) kinase
MYVIGIDIGTTGCKAIAVNERGEVAGTGYQGYGLITGSFGRVEQDPRQSHRGLVASVRQAINGLEKQSIKAVALSTQGASSLLADENFQPLTNAITWMDMRSMAQKDAMEKALGSEYIYRTTGWRANAALDMAKARWLADNEPELFRKAQYFISTIEYANAYLTGIAAIDPTNAAMRQLMDIHTKKWDPKILRCARLEECKLPQIVPSGSFLGCLTAAAAEELGLYAGVKVYNGAHDQYCGALGAAILKPGELMLSTGTAWVTLAISDKPVYSSAAISPGPHVIPGYYGALISQPTSGAALDWLRNNITGSSYEEINRNASRRIEGCRELFFYPYLSGSSFPASSGPVKAAFIGMDMDTDKYDLALACMEGVAFQLRLALDEYEACGIHVADMHVMGGAVGSKLWLTIVAAVCGRPMHVMQVKDTPCIGAACIAGVGAGLFEGYEQAAQLMNHSTVFDQPADALVQHYQDKYLRYKAIWASLKRVYEQDVRV